MMALVGSCWHFPSPESINKITNSLNQSVDFDTNL